MYAYIHAHTMIVNSRPTVDTDVSYSIFCTILIGRDILLRDI